MTALHNWREAAEGNLLDAASQQPHAAPAMIDAHRFIQNLTPDFTGDDCVVCGMVCDTDFLTLPGGGDQLLPVCSPGCVEVARQMKPEPAPLMHTFTTGGL